MQTRRGFLDIEMPGMSGIEFARWMQDNVSHPCKIVFVTAFKEFALNAFDFEAFDYLLKPFAEERFNSCISKLKKAFAEHKVVDEHNKLDKLLVSKTGNSIHTFMDNLQKAQPGKLSEMQRTISLKSGTQWLRVKLDSIFGLKPLAIICVFTPKTVLILSEKR